MIDKVNTQANIASMLATIRQYQTDATGKNTPAILNPTVSPSAAPEVGKPTFSDAIKSAVINTNNISQHASGLQKAYERGEDVPLTDVVLAMQKSSLAFEATLQVRNKVLKAYEDILNMPV